MKKLLLTILVCFVSLSVNASDFKNLPYKNIKENSKITISDSGKWSEKVNQQGANVLTRQGTTLRTNNSFPIDTGCKYLFIHNNKLFGYSDSALKFYEFNYLKGRILKKELNISQTAYLFREFHIITISEFSKSTNVFKMKQRRSEEKIMIINDTSRNFDNYTFSANNAEFKNYNINNAIGITKPGMIQFSKNEENTPNAPWFILLVR